jgi:hypothetical protein
VAVDAQGNVTVSGGFQVGIAIGAGTAKCPGASPCGYVLSYDAAGALRFGKTFGGASGALMGLTVALDPAGGLLVAGGGDGSLDLGGGPISASNQPKIVVARLDATGNHVWSRAVGDGLTAGALAVAPDGHVWAGVPGALVELDAAGTLVATHPLAGAGGRMAAALDFGPGGAPVVAGTFDTTIDLGHGPLTTGGGVAAFVATLAP